MLVIGAVPADQRLRTVPSMFTVAVWDLGEGRKPGTAQIPPVLRRVGADVVALVNHTASNSDMLARSCGYRHRAKLLRDSPPMVVLSRFPVSDANEAETTAGKIGRINVHLPHGVLALRVMDLSRSTADAAGAIRNELEVQQCTLLIVGNLGYDLSTVTGAWTALRGELTDLVEISGGHTRGERIRGILGRGIEARGAGTLTRAAGGATDLVWARMSI